MQKDLKDQIIAWASIHNLNYLIDFHNFVRGTFKEHYQNLEKLGIKDQERSLNKSQIKEYDRNLHINTFLMMYSYLEEWLYVSWKSYAPNVTLNVKKGSISRFGDIVYQLGVDLSSKYWQILIDAEEVRNCLLHANGRISLLISQKKIRDIIKKNVLILTIVNDRLVISGEYLKMFNNNITNIFDIINRSQDQSIK